MNEWMDVYRDNAFVSNCRSHDTLDKLDFYSIEVDDISIHDALDNFVNYGNNSPQPTTHNPQPTTRAVDMI